MAEFSILEEIPFYIWILLAVCVVLIIIGVILLTGRNKRKKNRAESADSMDLVHRVDDLSAGLDVAVDRQSDFPFRRRQDPETAEIAPAVSPAENENVSGEPAIPVAPYTSWDHASVKTDVKQEEASFAGFVDREPGTETLRTEAKRRVTVETEEEAADATVSILEPDQQLLLLKSHELLLTLSDGLKKLSVAKTDAARKEKIAEMQAAMKLLDAKNEWADYKACFEKLYPDFWPEIEELSSEEMSPYELRLCALLSLDMGTKEIADLTNRSIRTVETTIYKIRKKLGMESEDKTQDFLKRIRKKR